MAFEAFELGNEVSKAEFGQREKALRRELLDLQFDLDKAGFSVIVLVLGDDAGACEQVVDLFHEWMDARLLQTEVFFEPTAEERKRPDGWRYWRALPAHGRIGLIFGGWALDAVRSRLAKGERKGAFERRVEHIRTFEQALADDGTLVLKFWFHTVKKALKKRLEKASESKRSWRAAESERAIYKSYGEIVDAGSELVRETDRGHAPWIVVESADARYRDLRVMEALRERLTERLARPAPAEPEDGAGDEQATKVPRKSVLDTVDLSARVSKSSYRERLEARQLELKELSIRAREAEVSSVLVFEGWDAAGKGGAIRRMTGAMGAMDYRVIPIAAPNDEERAHHYLWRFWRRLPRAGRMAIFDRSWYGRVLVERVERFARPEEWRRAYAEITDFEEALVEHGIVVRKFWLHIDPDEQLERFRERERTGYKKYKITGEDYRNRERWPEYVEAVNEMVRRTHSDAAPWKLVSANDKRNARIEVIETVCDDLRAALERR